MIILTFTATTDRSIKYLFRTCSSTVAAADGQLFSRLAFRRRRRRRRRQARKPPVAIARTQRQNERDEPVEYTYVGYSFDDDNIRGIIIIWWATGIAVNAPAEAPAVADVFEIYFDLLDIEPDDIVRRTPSRAIHRNSWRARGMSDVRRLRNGILQLTPHEQTIIMHYYLLF